MSYIIFRILAIPRCLQRKKYVSEHTGRRHGKYAYLLLRAIPEANKIWANDPF
jgi:hypothetical protein